MEKRRQKIGIQIFRATDLGVVQYFSGSESINIHPRFEKQERTDVRETHYPALQDGPQLVLNGVITP